MRNQRLPSPPASITSVASRHGYIVDRDILTDTTKLRHPSGLEVEFLLGKVGAGMVPSLKTNIGVVAQTLRHLDILQREPLTVDYEGMTIGIPCPEVYVTQKMIVNDERGRKADKDAEAIKNLWPHLDKARHVRIVSSLTRRERIRYDRYLERHTSNMVD